MSDVSKRAILDSPNVAPPYNVTLHCGNLINQLSWNYDHPPAGLHFRVEIDRFFSSRKIPPLQVDLPQLQANVSFLSAWRDAYNLYVTAVLGNQTSERVPSDGVSFSYDVDSPTSHKCSLDLPPVTVLEQDEHFLLLSFQHPWLVYQHGLPSPSRKRRNEQQDDGILPLFMYDVTLEKKEFADLRCTEEVCRHRLPVEAGPRPPCVAISGELERIGVYGTRDYCARPVLKNRDVIIPVVASSLLLLAAVFAVLVMISWKRARPSSSELPASLRFDTRKEEMDPQLLVVETPPSESDVDGLVDEPVDEEEEEDRDADGEEMEEADEDVSDHHAYEGRNTVERLSPDEYVEGYR
ncbi:uncharacterized protein LOC144205713 isoform X2 [Stigmatopora nigra]